ncbi:MAG: aryl-sulfate sulfotransferase [Flavobacteriales bacterium]|nr:aryl-sulfate sulfotransferase [Flavobacteriales bacterium]
MLVFSGWNAGAQTVGLLENSPAAFDGYTLVAPTGATRTHLIDNCGRVINQWDSEYRAGESAYLLQDGSLLRTARIGSTTFNGGGIGGRIERFNWEGDLIWSYELATDTAHHHHDMAWLPNGNVVLMAWEYKSPEEAAAAGRTSEGPLWPPMLIEIEPAGTAGGNVVWEWHAWDHIVQSSDPALPHFGLPAENITRFDVNYGNVSGGGFPGGNPGGDWFHCNGLDYDPLRNHLMLNSRNWCEFYIIDHGTTTAEAAGPAGDLLYRWGNPQTHGRGSDVDKVFYQQHDAHWLLGEAPAASGGDPAQSVLVYNNGNGRPGGTGSTVDELVLPWDSSSGTYLLPSATDTVSFAPEGLDWTWPENPSTDFHSPNISGSQRQPNGNTLICEGASGHLFEITPDGETVWEYITAYSQFGAATQGENPFGNSTFRAYRYAPGYAAFEGRDMTPGEPVELNPLPFDCALYPAPVDTSTSGMSSLAGGETWAAYPNPSNGSFTISSPQAGLWRLLDGTGRTRAQGHLLEGRNSCTSLYISPGLYVLALCDFRGRPMGAPQLHIIR